MACSEAEAVTRWLEEKLNSGYIVLDEERNILTGDEARKFYYDQAKHYFGDVEHIPPVSFIHKTDPRIIKCSPKLS